MTPLDQKINQHFAGLVVRKDLTKAVKGNAIVPSYVLEYLLGQHCATDDEASIASGIETVRGILAKHFVHRNESELVKSTIKERGRHKIIDRVTVELNDYGGTYEGAFANLGVKKVQVDPAYVKKHPKLLVGGVWCIAELNYQPGDSPKQEPWHLENLKPIQVANVDLEQYRTARGEFTTPEWTDLLLQSIGFNPEMFSRRGKLIQLTRLVAFCERNFNLIELGPKGTGKSHVYSEFSPHGILISGGEVTAPKLFVSNTGGGKLGLVGYWDCVCFDEFAGKDKRVDKNLVDIMKNYMANRSFSRGVEMLGAEASMVFMGNTKKSVAYMLKHSHFFDQLPDKYIDSAFLDRLHGFNPGWEVAPIRHDLFTDGYGFVVDYIAEILKSLRKEDFAADYKGHFEIASEISTRDQTGFEKTFSGLMKVLYPDHRATTAEIEELLSFAMEARRRVREHILRIDDTFPRHDFAYRPVAGGTVVTVLTPEEKQFPAFAGPPGVVSLVDENKAEADELFAGSEEVEEDAVELDRGAPAFAPDTPRPGHVVVPENVKGWSYRRLFARHLRGAREIKVSDPYVRLFFQVRNLMELLQMIHELVPEGDEVAVRLVTQSDPETCVRQEENLNQVVGAFTGSRVLFSWDYDHGRNFHARSIVTDHGWKITIDRGLDIFQRFESGPFSLEQAMQEARLTRGTEVTFLRLDDKV